MSRGEIAVLIIKAYEKDRYDFMPSVHDFDVSSY
jgi:hypothetical protein